jgi:hypothetical protein
MSIIQNWKHFKDLKLNESQIMYSDKFMNLLKNVKDPVADSLASLSGQDLNTTINWIDFDKSDREQILCLQDKKAQKMLDELKRDQKIFWSSSIGIPTNSNYNKQIFQSLGFTPPEKGPLPRPSSSQVEGVIIGEYTSPKTGKVYALCDFEGLLCVINKEQLKPVDHSKKIWKTPKQPMRIGRATTALLKSAGINHSATQIADFVNKFKSEIDRLNDKFANFEMVTGDKIAYWYNMKNYDKPENSRGGDLYNSCMSRMDDETFDIYTQNPKVCSLLIFKSERDLSKIVGRALVWTLSDGKRFMDRAYTSEPDLVELYRIYATDNGIWAKFFNSNCPNSKAIDPSSGSPVELGNLEVELEKKNYSYFPYLDTLKYYSPSKSILSNSRDNLKGFGEIWTLESTSGRWSEYEGDGPCDYCNGSGNVLCNTCDGDGVVGDNSTGSAVRCERCDGHGEVDCPDCSW